MGNRALRKQLGKQVGKFSTANKFVTRKLFNANILRRLIADSSVKVGDVLNDCDGYNHRIAKINHKWYNVGRHYSDLGSHVKGKILYNVEIIFEDGRFRCECDAICPAYSKEKIESHYRECVSEPIEEGYKGWLDTPYMKEIARRLNNNEPICNDDGIILPEIDKLSRVYR